MRFSCLIGLLAGLSVLPVANAQSPEKAAVFVQTSSYRADGRRSGWFVGEERLRVLRGGAEVLVLQGGGLAGHVGLAVDAASRRAEGTSETYFDTGMQIRFIDVYRRVESGSVAATLGGQVSLSCAGTLYGPDQRFGDRRLLGDCQHAVWGRLEATSHAVRFATVSGGVIGALTLPLRYETGQNATPQRVSSDRGDGIAAFIDAEALLSESLSVGGAVVYSILTAPGSNERAAFGWISGNGFLSLAPYLEVASPRQPVVFRLALEAPGVARSEHVWYGIPLTDDPNSGVRLPVTVSMRVRI